MRTSILCAAFLGLFAAGCAGDLSGTGGDDQQIPETCGNGTVDSGETCDDSNNASGDGCSAACQTEQPTNTPRVDISVDKPSVNTNLLVGNEVNVTLTSVNGFTGDVTLAATVDAGGTALTGWNPVFSTTTVTLAAEATGTAKVTFRVPGDTSSLTGSVKVTATSTAAPASATVAVTSTDVAVITYNTTGSNCVYPTEYNLSNPIRLTVGRKLRVVNNTDPATTGCGGAACQMQIHVDGGTGIDHQAAPMAAGAAYEDTVTAANATGVTFYCHNANSTAVATEAGAQSSRQRLITVQ